MLREHTSELQILLSMTISLIFMKKNKSNSLNRKSTRKIGWEFTEKNQRVHKEISLSFLEINLQMLCGDQRRKKETEEEISKVKIVAGEEVEAVAEEEEEGTLEDSEEIMRGIKRRSFQPEKSSF